MPDLAARLPFAAAPDLALYRDVREFDVWARLPFAAGPDLVLYPRGPVAVAAAPPGGDPERFAEGAWTTTAQTAAGVATVLVTAACTVAHSAQTGAGAGVVLVTIATGWAPTPQLWTCAGTVAIVATCTASPSPQADAGTLTTGTSVLTGSGGARVRSSGRRRNW